MEIHAEVLNARAERKRVQSARNFASKTAWIA
jgi:hypothetical protein